MKILNINKCKFKLPDNFKGGLPEALRLIADYLDNEPVEGDKSFRDNWSGFLTLIETKGKLSGQFSISEFVGETNETNSM